MGLSASARRLPLKLDPAYRHHAQVLRPHRLQGPPGRARQRARWSLAGEAPPRSQVAGVPPRKADGPPHRSLPHYPTTLLPQRHEGVAQLAARPVRHDQQEQGVLHHGA